MNRTGKQFQQKPRRSARLPDKPLTAPDVTVEGLPTR